MRERGIERERGRERDIQTEKYTGRETEIEEGAPLGVCFLGSTFL